MNINFYVWKTKIGQKNIVTYILMLPDIKFLRYCNNSDVIAHW